MALFVRKARQPVLTSWNSTEFIAVSYKKGDRKARGKHRGLANYYYLSPLVQYSV